MRENFGFESTIESDCAALAAPVAALFAAGVTVHCLRDLTRGGLASALVEIAEAAAVHIEIEESRIPVRADVGAACELLGLDPLHVANEGRFIAVVPAQDAELALRVLRARHITAGAVAVGVVRPAPAGQVFCRGELGVSRVIDMLSGEQLPRIC